MRTILETLLQEMELEFPAGCSWTNSFKEALTEKLYRAYDAGVADDWSSDIEKNWAEYNKHHGGE
jgi:hypothetical protein